MLMVLKYRKMLLDLLLQIIKNNVREIEGVVTSILLQATLNKQEINLDLAKRTVLNFVKT